MYRFSNEAPIILHLINYCTITIFINFKLRIDYQLLLNFHCDELLSHAYFTQTSLDTNLQFQTYKPVQTILHEFHRVLNHVNSYKSHPLVELKRQDSSTILETTRVFAIQFNDTHHGPRGPPGIYLHGLTHRRWSLDSRLPGE